MAQTMAELKTRGAGGGGADVVPPGYGDYGGGGQGDEHRIGNARLGLWIALGSIATLFTSFTIAFAVRSAGGDWEPLEAPPLLFLNTAVLIASSVTVEGARRRFESWRPLAFRRWMLLTAALGTTFLMGQFVVWHRLSEQRAGLLTHPHGSFFYLLSGLHALHLAAGLAVLLYVLASRYRLLPGESSSPALASTYWHFMDALWLCLLAVLFYL